MRTDKMTLAFAYLRLSNEEAREGESSSIGSQRMMIQNYCKQHGITLVREFADATDIIGTNQSPERGRRFVPLFLYPEHWRRHKVSKAGGVRHASNTDTTGPMQRRQKTWLLP